MDLISKFYLVILEEFYQVNSGTVSEHQGNQSEKSLEEQGIDLI